MTTTLPALNPANVRQTIIFWREISPPSNIFAEELCSCGAHVRRTSSICKCRTLFWMFFFVPSDCFTSLVLRSHFADHLGARTRCEAPLWRYATPTPLFFCPFQTAHSTQMNFAKLLPKEIVVHIFRFLNAQDLHSLLFVCREWNRLSTDEGLWKKLLLDVYPKSVANCDNLGHSCEIFNRRHKQEMRWKGCTPFVSNGITYSSPTHESHSDVIRCLAVDKYSGHIATGSRDQCIKVIVVNLGKSLTPQRRRNK